MILLGIVLSMPIVYISIVGGIFIYGIIIDKDIFSTSKIEVTYDGKELNAKEICSRSGITFPNDTLLIGNCHGEDKNDICWYYTSKEPFKLPENLDELEIITLENQTYDLTLGGVGNLCWRSDEKPFKLPVDLDELYLQNNLGFANKEALVSRVKELEAKGEEWVAESDLELDEKMFSCYFKTNIVGATESWSANWITNNFAFEAEILKTPEKYYLHLWSREALPSELEALKAKEVAVE
ncbi:MAG: hypothetical protein J6W90_04345 [Verrucomicrobia bacterium]|nr:hypothetical protein [Verrucomicrobiota bacterium]